MAKSQKERVKEWIALLSDPNKWTKGALAVNKKGLQVAWASREAVKWCALGGVYKFDLGDLLKDVETRLGDDIAEVNDGPNGRRRVLAAVKKEAKALGYI